MSTKAKSDGRSARGDARRQNRLLGGLDNPERLSRAELTEKLDRIALDRRARYRWRSVAQ